MSGPQRQTWWPAYVGVGSNIDDPVGHVRRALQDIARLPDTRLVAHSSLYRSRPMGPIDQPDYVNAVAGLLTRLEPAGLLSALLDIERTHGRRRDEAVRWGPRSLDLDLLDYAGRVVDEPGLHLPHPGIAERNFVLLPLASIAPDLEIAGLGRVGHLAERTGRDGLACLDRDSPY